MFISDLHCIWKWTKPSPPTSKFLAWSRAVCSWQRGWTGTGRGRRCSLLSGPGPGCLPGWSGSWSSSPGSTQSASCRGWSCTNPGRSSPPPPQPPSWCCNQPEITNWPRSSDSLFMGLRIQKAVSARLFPHLWVAFSQGSLQNVEALENMLKLNKILGVRCHKMPEEEMEVVI